MKPGDVVVAKVGCDPYYIAGSLGVVLQIDTTHALVNWVSGAMQHRDSDWYIYLDDCEVVGRLTDEPTQTIRHAEPDIATRAEG